MCNCFCPSVYVCLESIWTPEHADSWTRVFGRPRLTPALSRCVSCSVMFSLTLSSLSFLTKPKGNQRTLAETGQPRAQSKQRTKIPSTAHTKKHTKTHWQHLQRLICQDIHMLHIHTQIYKKRHWQHHKTQTVSSLLECKHA